VLLSCCIDADIILTHCYCYIVLTPISYLLRVTVMLYLSLYLTYLGLLSCCIDADILSTWGYCHVVLTPIYYLLRVTVMLY